MSIFAAAYALKPDTEVPERLRSALSGAISRREADTVDAFSSRRFYAATLDVGAYGDNAKIVRGDRGFSFLAGEILLSGSDTNRTVELESVVKDPRKLGRANGVFALISFDADQGCLTVATDKLGIRPVYFWADNEFVIVASSIRILEAIS